MKLKSKVFVEPEQVVREATSLYRIAPLSEAVVHEAYRRSLYQTDPRGGLVVPNEEEREVLGGQSSRWAQMECGGLFQGLANVWCGSGGLGQ
jgi:hypothetical protein